MKRKTFAFVAFASVLITATTIVYHSQHETAAQRNPAHVIRDLELVFDNIYSKAAWLVKKPVTMTITAVVKGKLKSFVKELNLDKAVEEKVMKQIEDAKYMKMIFPLLLFIKDIYMPSQYRKGVESFEAYILKNHPDFKDLPGGVHTLFDFEVEKKKQSEKPDPKAEETKRKLIGSLVTFYSVVYIDNEQTPLGNTLPNRATDEAAIKRAMPVVKEALLNAISMLSELAPGDESENTIIEIANNEKRLKALTTTAIEFIDLQVFKHFQMYVQEETRKEELRNWLKTEIRKQGGGRAFDYLWNAYAYRRFGAHLTVDGLQGHLVKALVNTSNGTKGPFLEEIFNDHLNAKNYQPQTQLSITVKDKSGKDFLQRMDFLEYLNKNQFSHQGYLPFFKEPLTNRSYTSSNINSAGILEMAIATTPTISSRNLPEIWNGTPPAGTCSTGIPNFHFVERSDKRFPRGRAYYFYGNDAFQMERLTTEAGMKTLHQRFAEHKNYVTFNTMNCGAQYDKGAQFTIDGFLALAAGEKSRDFGELACINELQRRAGNEIYLTKWRKELIKIEKFISNESEKNYKWRLGAMDKKIGKVFSRTLGFATRYNDFAMIDRMIDKIAELEDEGMPRYLIVYNPWPDHFAHPKGPFSDELISPTGELNRLDYWLSELVQTYKRAGIYDRTLFGLAGDHGLAPTYFLLNPEKVLVSALKDKGINIKYIKISSDEGEGPKLNSPYDPDPMDIYEMVVASTAGGNFMFDFFNSRQGWRTQPIYSEMTRFKPKEAKDPYSTIDMIELIRTELSESLDYLAVREAPSNPQQTKTRPVTTRDGKRIDAIITRIGEKIFYDSSTDLLKIQSFSPYISTQDVNVEEHNFLLQKCFKQADPNNMHSWCNEDEWRLLTRYSVKPDAVAQLSHLYDSNIAGTVNLFPKDGIGYNSKVSGRHAGENFHEKDPFLGFWGKPVSTNKRIPCAVHGSLPATMYEYLTGEQIKAGENCWGYASLASQLF